MDKCPVCGSTDTLTMWGSEGKEVWCNACYERERAEKAEYKKARSVLADFADEPAEVSIRRLRDADTAD